MADDAIDRLTERLRMARVARGGNAGAPGSAAAAVARRGSDRYPIGARVFDVLLGQDGVIVAPPPGNSPTRDRVYVKFDSGVTNARPPADLLVRPTPPPARS
jgi:hypothetical protein